MLYSKPEMEVIKFEILDVICTSDGVTIEDSFDGTGGNSSVGGSWLPQQ